LTFDLAMACCGDNGRSPYRKSETDGKPPDEIFALRYATMARNCPHSIIWLADLVTNGGPRISILFWFDPRHGRLHLVDTASTPD